MTQAHEKLTINNNSFINELGGELWGELDRELRDELLIGLTNNLYWELKEELYNESNKWNK